MYQLVLPLTPAYELRTANKTHLFWSASQAKRGEPLSPGVPYVESGVLVVFVTKLQSDINGVFTIPPVLYEYAPIKWEIFPLVSFTY